MNNKYKLFYLDGNIEESYNVPLDFTGITELDNCKQWYVNGLLHRIDGPSCEYREGDKLWFFHGKRHREDGVAIEECGGLMEKISRKNNINCYMIY